MRQKKLILPEESLVEVWGGFSGRTTPCTKLAAELEKLCVPPAATCSHLFSTALMKGAKQLEAAALRWPSLEQPSCPWCHSGPCELGQRRMGGGGPPGHLAPAQTSVPTVRFLLFLGHNTMQRWHPHPLQNGSLSNVCDKGWKGEKLKG